MYRITKVTTISDTVSIIILIMVKMIGWSCMTNCHPRPCHRHVTFATHHRHHYRIATTTATKSVRTTNSRLHSPLPLSSAPRNIREPKHHAAADIPLLTSLLSGLPRSRYHRAAVMPHLRRVPATVRNGGSQPLPPLLPRIPGAVLLRTPQRRPRSPSSRSGSPPLPAGARSLPSRATALSSSCTISAQSRTPCRSTASTSRPITCAPLSHSQRRSTRQCTG